MSYAAAAAKGPKQSPEEVRIQQLDWVLVRYRLIPSTGVRKASFHCEAPERPSQNGISQAA